MHTDGRARKSLAEQIDRLDKILDGLADALNEAVADAVTQAVSLAVKEAVQSVLTEVLSNPALGAQLRATTFPVAPVHEMDVSTAVPTPSSGLATRLCLCVAWVQARLRAACHLGKRFLEQIRRLPQATWVGLCWLSHRWRPLVIAVGVGCTLGGLAYLAGPWLCTGAGGLAGFTTTLALQARAAFKRLFDTAPASVHQPLAAPAGNGKY
jgi:hypothetical protein